MVLAPTSPRATGRLFEDLATFARVEVASGDLEPWAVMIRSVADRMQFDEEQTLWLVKLYNAYDSLSSAWQVLSRWGSPAEWARASDQKGAAQYYCTQERRNLRGGLVLRHLDSYHTLLMASGGQQGRWLRSSQMDFLALMAWTRQVWGVGRQTAFEWVEFLAKAADFPVTAPDARLQESAGPRRSLQSLFNNPAPTLQELDAYARATRQFLADRGVSLAWEDLETVICDFHVMRLGRYYPGRHLAALRGEIDEIPSSSDRAMLLEVFHSVIPEPWSGVPPGGINKQLLPVYRQTGRMIRFDGVAVA